jgi:hypothetical protein
MGWHGDRFRLKGCSSEDSARGGDDDYTPTRYNASNARMQATVEQKGIALAPRLDISRLFSRTRGRDADASARRGRFGEGLFFALCLLVGTGALLLTLFWITVPVRYWLVLVLSAALIVVGLGGLSLVFWQLVASRERRAVIAKRASDIELFDESAKELPEFPAVPSDAELRNSPGTTLAYRLPIATSSGWKLFALTTVCLAWNGVVILFVVLEVRRHWSGDHDWLTTLMVALFAAAGTWLMVYTIRAFWKASRIGPTRVEISDHPLVPGEEYQLFLSQSGRLSVEKLEMLLVCEEEATFRQGTDTVTSSQTVRVHPLFEKQHFEIDPREPFEVRCSFSVPAGAMHSFRADHNTIKWKLVIRNKATRQRDFERSYPVVIVPAAQGESRNHVGITAAPDPANSDCS